MAGRRTVSGAGLTVGPHDYRAAHELVRNRRRGSWFDLWLTDSEELLLGCVLLVISGWWWFESRGAVWEGWKNVASTATVVLAPWLVNRAWSRRSEISKAENRLGV